MYKEKNGQSVKNKGGCKAGHNIFGVRGQKDTEDQGQKWVKEKNKKIIKTKMGV